MAADLNRFQNFLVRLGLVSNPEPEPNPLLEKIASLEDALAETRLENELLQQEIQELKSLRLEELRNKDAETKEWVATFEHENARLQQELNALRGQVDALGAERDAISNRLTKSEAKQEQLERHRQARRLEKDLEITIATLLPNVELIHGSGNILVDGIYDLRDVLQQLRLISTREISRSTRVEGAPAWREVHYSTGASNAGRIYYSDVFEDGKIRILISSKTLQARDIKYLAKLRRH